MPLRFGHHVGVALLFFTCGQAVGLGEDAASTTAVLAKHAIKTALDEYVAKPDSSFEWKVVSRNQGFFGTELVIDLTSQSWRPPGEVNRGLWKHWLTVVVPPGAKSDVALLIIAGGANDREAPQGASQRVRAFAMASGATVAEVGMIPNQPLIFADGVARKEDSLLAYTWDQFLKTDDPTWPGQLPMTKSAVRAMDAIQAALAEEDGAPQVKRFVVAGGSKRGWTTWLTAAVDERVVAIAPIVIDLLNIDKSMRNHHGVYGFWAPALDDYVEFGLPDKRDDPEYQQLLKLVDPYTYRERLTMPKCIINASGDEFFTPDSSQFYFDDLPGENLLSYQPNTGHSLEGSKVLETLTAFFTSVVRDLPRPKVKWELTEDNEWRVTCEPSPRRAMLWQATNPEARDFRLPTIGEAYQGTELKPTEAGVYVGGAQEPAAGFTAYFIQLEFDIGAATPLFVSTPVRVTPEIVPFADQLK
jgi:PhoPQ-activated pathogenicity-related protein